MSFSALLALAVDLILPSPAWDVLDPVDDDFDASLMPPLFSGRDYSYLFGGWESWN